MKSNTIALGLALLSAASGFAACATTQVTPPKPHYAGICQHPGVKGGQPFPLPPDAKVDGNFITVFFGDGTQVTLYGANCVLEEERP